MKKERKRKKNLLCIDVTAIFGWQEALQKAGRVCMSAKDENVFELKKKQVVNMENLGQK